MAASIDLQFQCEGFSEDTFEVLRFSGEEAISRLYSFQIDLVTDNPDAIDIDTLQERPSTLTISTSDDQRLVQGIISHVDTIDRADGGALFRITLVPRVWELTQGTTNKIYLDTTTPDIIRQILEQAGITEADYELQLEGQYRNWAFRFQYGESYWDFLSRILERDGIYYYFVPGESAERICFCDTWREQPDIQEPDVEFSAALGFGPTDAASVVHSMVARHTRILRTLTLQNYNDAQPSTAISSRIEVDPSGAGEENIYGQKALDQGEADSLAEIRAEELRWQKQQYHGDSTIPRLCPGHRFELTGHPRELRNGAYQVLSIEHHGYNPRTAHLGEVEAAPDQAVYENSFTAIPSETQFRPRRLTPQPMITGTLNARIDAEGTGEYAEIDEEGRYHVIFPFDTTHPSGRASHWVRLMQPYAGEREGMHFPLRKRARVLISFLAGDPDLPVINGAVPDAEQLSVTTADRETKGALRTAGGNAVETDDMQTRERITLSSPTQLSRMQVGADELSGSAAPTQLGAPGHYEPEQSEDPDGNGVVVETQGMVRFAYFGGGNHVQAANKWAVDTTLWSDSIGYRDSELGNTLDTLADYSNHDLWRVKHGTDRVFQFPRKHGGESHTSDYLTKREEASGKLFISRTIGDEYSYRSGTSFHFSGVDRETFDFGPRFAYTSSDHDKDSQELRDTVRQSIEGISAGDSGIAYQYVEMAEAHEAYVAKSNRLDALEREMENLRADAERCSTHYDNIPGVDLPNGDTLVFESDEDLDRWLTLANYDRQASPSGAITRVSQWLNGAGLGGQLFLTGYVVLPDQLTSAGPSSPSSDSVEAARREAEQAESDYERKRAAYESAAPESDRDVSEDSIAEKLRRGRVDVREYDAFAWHSGDIYDFGGADVFNFGGGYEETHTGAYEDTQADSGAWRLDSVRDHGRKYDLIQNRASDGTITWDPANVIDPVKSQLNGPYLIDKTIGDTYDYHNGNSIEVHVGDSLSVDAQTNVVELEYSNDVRRRDFRKQGPTYQEWQYDSAGRLTFFESADNSAGHNAFTFSAAYSNTMSISTAASASFAISLGATYGIDVSVGVSRQLEFAVSGAQAISFTAGLDLDLSLAAAVTIGMDFSASVNIGIERANAANIDIDLTTTPPTLELSAAAVRLYTQVGYRAVSVTGMHIDQETSQITVQSFRMKQTFQMTC